MVLPIAYGLGALALRAAPFALRAGKALIKPGNIKKYFIGTGARTPASGIGPVLPRTRPGMFRRGPYGLNTVAQFGAIPAGMAGYDYLTGEAEQSAATPPPNFNDGDNPEGVSPGAGNTRRGDSGKTKPEKDDAKITSDQIKSGELDDFIKERIDLFEKYIGDDTRKRTKTAGYNAMVQFGLNLATKRGSLVEGIAESAKEPLKEFAKLGNDLMDRAQQIKKAGIESGVSAYDKSKDRELDEKAIAADILKERIKANAKELSPGQFYTVTRENIMSSPELQFAITGDSYESDGRTKKEGALSDKELIENYISQSYNAYNAVEIPSGESGKELYESLPSGTMVFYDGNFFEKP
jgi:hypothetical protein